MKAREMSREEDRIIYQRLERHDRVLDDLIVNLAGMRRVQFALKVGFSLLAIGGIIQVWWWH
jgi:uncharacterized ion transporter superfamily protein YfcC